MSQSFIINYKRVVKESPKAILILEESHEKFMWIPKSQIMHQDQYASGQGFIQIPMWLFNNLKVQHKLSDW